MIEQVIDKEGKVYDVVYSPIVKLTLDGSTAWEVDLRDLEDADFRPYKVNGKISRKGLLPWEGLDTLEAAIVKDKWTATKRAFEDAGYAASYQESDLLLSKNGRMVVLGELNIRLGEPLETVSTVNELLGFKLFK